LDLGECRLDAKPGSPPANPRLGPWPRPPARLPSGVAGDQPRRYPAGRDVPRTHPEDWRKKSRCLRWPHRPGTGSTGPVRPGLAGRPEARSARSKPCVTLGQPPARCPLRASLWWTSNTKEERHYTPAAPPSPGVWPRLKVRTALCSVVLTACGFHPGLDCKLLLPSGGAGGRFVRPSVQWC
jgi:hypothetical protein